MSEREPDYSGKNWNDSSLHISTKGFRCAFCGKQRKGAWRYVDGGRSCEICNREYDPPKCNTCELKQPQLKIKCPLCKGKGYLINEEK